MVKYYYIESEKILLTSTSNLKKPKNSVEVSNIVFNTLKKHLNIRSYKEII
jgi:hypothetical protein